MNLKKKIVITAVVITLIVVVVVPGILLFNGISAFSVASQNLDLSVQELRSLHNKEPFPSRDNIKRERANVLATEQWFKELITALQEGQIEEESSTPTGFITHYGRVRNDLMKLARQRSRQMVGNEFSFGFKRYSDGSLPAPVDVARLLQQLRIIEQVSVVLIESGVKQIADIKRDVFESSASVDTDETTAPGPRASRRRPSSRRAPSRQPSRSAASRAAGGASQQAGGLYRKHHLTVDIRASEMAVLEILNRLATHRMFVVVTGVSFAKTGPDLRMPESETTGTDMDILSQDAPAKAAPLDDDDEQPRQKRKVSGSEFEIPMRVTIDLDVYTFASGSEG